MFNVINLIVLYIRVKQNVCVQLCVHMCAEARSLWPGARELGLGD